MGLVRVEEVSHELFARGVFLGLLGSGSAALLGDFAELRSWGGQKPLVSLDGDSGRVELLHELGVVCSALATTSLLGSFTSGSDNRLDLVRVDDGRDVCVGHFRSQQSVTALKSSASLVVSEHL